VKLSQGQLARFWREWSEACRVAGWTEENGYGKNEREELRKLLLARAGFTSLTLVTRVEGFDRVLAELSALHHPGDLDAQMAIAENGFRVLRHAILSSPLGAAWRAIAADRWRVKMGESPTDEDLVKLDASELRQLRDTLRDRGVEQHRPETLARRRQKRATMEAEIPPERCPF
jgi:hypothetical protein